MSRHHYNHHHPFSPQMMMRIRKSMMQLEQESTMSPFDYRVTVNETQKRSNRGRSVIGADLANQRKM
jgi:hypothetical protein